MQPHYHANVFWNAPDNCWVADVPDLRACSAFGDTPQEALAEVQIAMEGWLQVATDRGLTIPEPLYRPNAGAGQFAA